jgi:ABC-type enterochelin transport system ATPase subunit
MSLSLKRLHVSGGYLEKTQIQFSEGLNCIIGARGTCKSTVVETIRFLFDCDAGRIEELIQATKTSSDENISHRGLLAETLGTATGTCVVEIAGQEPCEITMEREIGSTTRIYREGVKQVSGSDVLKRVEIYSQGDLQRIAAEPKRRLELIDRAHYKKVTQLYGERGKLCSELKEIGTKVRTLKTGIESKRGEVRSLEAFRQEYAQVQGSRPTLSPELDRQRNEHTLRKAKLDQAVSTADAFAFRLGQITELAGVESRLRSTAGSLTELKTSASGSLSNSFVGVANAIHAFREASEQARASIVEGLSELHKEVEVLDQAYLSLRKGQEELNQALRKEDQLRQQISHLEKVSAQVDEWSAELQQMIERRRHIRQQIASIGDEIFSARLEQVDAINVVYNDRILLTLKQGGHTSAYRQFLIQLLARSRLRNQDEIGRDIAGKIRPSELVDMVEAGASDRLAQILDRDIGQMVRLVGYLVDNPELYEIESQPFDDELDIVLFDNGVPKRVDQLSKGQKATAILPLVLQEGDCPLIFDQPEDDLDNRFIFETLVHRIQELKLKRQLIFITHNANIPVLGDADHVVVMQMATPKQTGVPKAGAVDDVKGEILSLLEGGAEAFKMRQVRYTTLLT